jgi:hypothetical protein
MISDDFTIVHCLSLITATSSSCIFVQLFVQSFILEDYTFIMFVAFMAKVSRHWLSSQLCLCIWLFILCKDQFHVRRLVAKTPVVMITDSLITSPDAGVLGIWGDFDSSAVKVMLRQYFGDWQTSLSSELTGKNGILMVANGRPALETGISASGPNIYVVDRPGLSQGCVPNILSSGRFEVPKFKICVVSIL